ncbi:hypothetical protein [uncultured Maribacter sp.]|uniref:hypothetical protein n=1 Tax=uncultured Maribacter sp. TaxID=431308 RepID=UPI0026359D65|nr:hypothetical protein [uncultured Maribacter sp.]
MFKSILKPGKEEKVETELWFRTEMTYRQFKALAHKLKGADIENELINLNYFVNQLSAAKNIKLNNVEMWLKNSWNTENVLFHNKSIIQNTGQSFSMQWAFPQAYYSAFCSILAYYKSVGFTQMSHNAVLKEFGNLLSQNKYPESLSMYTSGSKKLVKYHNIIKPKTDSSIDLNLSKPETIENQICQFLKSTREQMSDSKAPKMKFKTKNGKTRKNLTPQMWEKVSESIGYTTIMDFLYRKRIKANYLDIETFNAKEFKGEKVLDDLCCVINRLNLVNEMYVAKAIGIENYQKMLEKHLKLVDNKIVGKRFETIQVIIKTVK